MDKDDEEPPFLHMHNWDGLKGISSQTAACAKGGGAVWASSPGCRAVSLYCQSGRAAASHQGRANVWASHLQLINSYTLILTADHN